MANDRLLEVFRSLFTGCAGVVELRALPSRRRQFVEVGAAGALRGFCANRRGEGCYWGVATRREAGDGSLANCQHLGAFFSDLDGAGSLGLVTLPPSIVIGSGRGKHLYWLLNEPVDLQLAGQRELAYRILRNLASAIGGDMAAAEPARILRIPGSQNHKFHPAKEVVVESCDPARRYALQDFEPFMIKPQPLTTMKRVDLSEPVAEGARNDAMYRLIRALHAKHLPSSVIDAAVRAVNQAACNPPLPDDELNQLIAHGLRQPTRARAEIVVELAR